MYTQFVDKKNRNYQMFSYVAEICASITSTLLYLSVGWVHLFFGAQKINLWPDVGYGYSQIVLNIKT